ncbi:MAG: phosphoribosylanthranilate isomerase [Lachnospiraceae bacterium]|nr:phosphoribosylanthranilate isomerase [Lachnospiraceae bacterium]
MKIKICGLTSPAEAEYLNRNHVDYAGMVLFFSKSRRNISLTRAKEIMAELDPAIQKVAVLVSPTAEQVREVAEAGFDILQAHGEVSGDIFRAYEEVPEDIFQIHREITDDNFQTQGENSKSIFQTQGEKSGDIFQVSGEKSMKIQIWKAFNVKDMDRYEEYHANKYIHGYVFDAAVPGSGKTFDWNLVKSIPRDEKQFLLAGGLHPGNVKDAIRVLHPDGVDVSSGVERPEGGKDGRLVDEFVAAVREA